MSMLLGEYHLFAGAASAATGQVWWQFTVAFAARWFQVPRFLVRPGYEKYLVMLVIAVQQDAAILFAGAGTRATNWRSAFELLGLKYEN